MATRKTEWLASIKPILDKEEVKNDAKALAKELSDILEFKVTDAESLEQLTKEFNKQLVNMGKQQIVFSEKTLQGIVSQFANAIADGLSAGVNLGTGKLGQNIGDGIANGIVSGVKQGIADASSEIIAQINDLTKRKNELHEQSSKLDKRLKRYETLSEISTMEYDEFKPLKIDGDIDEQAQHIMGEFIDAEDALNEVTRGTKEYNAALIKALQASEKLYRMSRTINDNKDLVKDKTLLSDFEFSNLSDTTADVFEKADTDFNKILRNFYGYYEKQIKNIKVELGQIDEQMQALQQNKVEIIDQEKSKSALKTLKEIEEAYNRILKKEKSAEKVNEKISSAINYIPGSESLAVLKNRYDKSLSSNENWEVQYQWLVKFVKEYEDYAAKVDAETDGIKRRNMRAKLRRYDELYNQVSPIANIAEASLNQIIGNGVKPKGSGGSATSGPSQEDVDNANKIAEAGRQAREDTEAKTKAEKEAAEFAKQRRVEEEKTKALILEQKDAILEILSKSNEVGLFLNSKTGSVSDIVEGGKHSVETTLGAWRQASTQYDARLHKHNFDIAAPSFNSKENDFATWIKGFEYIKKQMILANTEILSFDFSSLSKKTLQNIADTYSRAAREIDKEFDGYIKNRKVGEVFGTIENMNEQMQVRLREVLEKIMADYQGVMTSYQLPPDIISAHKNKKYGVPKSSSYQKMTDGIQHVDDRGSNVSDIKKITKQNDSNFDDDSEIIAKENGLLEDKLELLRDIADQYAANITQKQRDRYEELNQKDMDSGLSDKEEERYYELGEQIDAADSALEEFGQTYDKIILKLENGKKVEILPDDKGLRSLYKFADEYGETYGGVEIEDVVFDRVKQEANAHQENTGAIKNETKAQEELNNAKGKSQGTGDASSADVAAANAEAEKQRLEKERIEAEKIALQQEITNKNEELGRVRDELADETYKHSEARSVLIAHIDEVEEERDKAFQSQVNAEREITEKDKVIKDLREQLAQVQSGDGPAKSSIDVEELKNVLNAITYNVKVVQDADNTDNKVAIDEASLEATLNKVFANILNPQTQQNDGENNQSPWALESTLQTVKGVLDNIQTNTAKIGTVNASNVDTIAGTALDSRLSEIKNVLDSIDNKIAKGGVIATRGAVKQAGANVQTAPANAQVARSNMMKSIINDYETLGKLSAQFANDGNLETKAKLENLKEEIKRKRESLKVTMEENAKLREKYSVAFDAQKRLLDAAKAQEDINQQGKDDEKAWKKRVKDAQRASGINAATSAANAGDQSVLRAIGTDGISADIEKQARELSNRIKELRALRDEIDKKGNQASEEDRDNLSKQISQVKTLKTELDGYLKIHEKYSGDNVTDLGDASTFGAAGTDEYWNNITKAIQAQSTGRVVIKGLNADTGELTGTTKIAANTFAQWSATVDPITRRLSMLRTGIKKSETLIESITRKTKEIFTYFSGSSIIFKFFNELKRGVQYVKEIDLALTELKKVTDETEETYDKFLQTAAKTGARLGTTISAVTEATATFAKLGYSMEQAAEMAEAALVYKNVGDNIASAEDAADSIISTLKGFKLEASDSMLIVDKFNEVKSCLLIQ